MTSRSAHRLVIAVLALVAVFAAAPAAHAAYGVKKAKFNAVFEAERTISWSIPRYETPQSCFSTYYYAGSGDESWKVKSRRSTKVLAQRIGTGSTTLLVGSWTPGQGGSSSIEAGGLIDRSAFEQSGYKPGPCGGSSKISRPHNSDCGSRLPSHLVRLSLYRGRLTPNPYIDGTRPYRGYSDCVIHTPDGVSDRALGLPASALSNQTLFGTNPKVVVRGSKTYTLRKPYGGSQLSSTAKVTWKLTLTRAG